MDSGTKTREYRTLQENSSKIVDSLSATVDPGSLALKLHEVGLVTRSTVDSANVIYGMTPAQRIRPILTAILSQVELDASKYHSFVTVLEHFNPTLAHCFIEKPTRKIVKATNGASTDTLDIACLGQPFRLGMLYDCRSDCLVPGVTLWDSSMLQQATDQRPQTKTHFELISDDSFASKTFHLGMQANLKLNFLVGLSGTAGSAKYLDDHKSSNKLQARVTLKYSSTTRFEELAVEKLGTVRHSTVSRKATHIVTGVLYGADAFFVFDQEVAPSGNYQTVHENMRKVIKSLPDTVTAADMTKVQCTVYCDIRLPENPTSFQDAAKLLKALPKVVESSNSAVPKRVQLFPLNKLGSSTAKILHKITPELVAKTERFVETFYKLQMQCNDIMKMEATSSFPAIQKQLSRFQQVFTLYKSSITEELASLLPRVRGGEAQEADMIQIFTANNDSPFGSEMLLSWLDKKEREVKMLAGYLNSLKEIPFVSSPNELDAIVYSIENDFVVCFSFLVTEENDVYLHCLSDYIQAPQLTQGFGKSLPKQWHEDRTIVLNMRSQARQFKDFFNANKTQKDTKFIVSSCANLDNNDNEGAVTILFKHGLREKFLPPTEPSKATAMKVTNDSILLKWGTPKCGAESVQSYVISYRMESDPIKQWKVKKTQDSTNTSMITHLAPKSKYYFKVHALCEVGVSPESEMSDPVETRDYRVTQIGNETFMSSEPISYQPVSISRPGKPNPSKVTSNTVHLYWNTPESGTQSINFYTVLYRRMDDLSAQWETVKTQGAQGFVIVGGLAAKAVYCFKIRAECEGGVGPDSELSDSIQTSPPSLPGKPGKPTVSKVTHNSIHLKWPGPKSGIEGVKIYSVICRRMDDPSAQWQTTKTQDSQKELTVSGLAAKAVYCFKIRAECEGGVGPDSELSDSIQTSPPSLPGKPGKPTVSKVTHNSIHLNWPAPDSGIEDVKFYSVLYRRMDDPSAQWQATKTQDSQDKVTVSGLAAEAVYCFKVRAESEGGVSPDSELSDPVATSSPVPGRPGKPTVSKVTHNSIHLNWPGPKSGIEGVTFYSVLYRRMDNISAEWQTTKTQDSRKEVTVSGLAAKAVYCFKVCAESEAGNGPDSEMCDPVATTPAPAPGRPGKPTATKVTHNSVHLDWPGPIRGIESVNCYSVIYRRMDDPSAQWQTIQTQDSQKELAMSGLAPKAVYCFKVCAESEAGVSPDSELSDPIRTTPAPAPGRPGKPTVTKVMHNSIHLNWPAPDSGIEDVKFHSVLYRRVDDPSAEWQTTKTQDSQSEVTVSGLVAQAVYCFKVRAESEAGNSPDSEMCDPIRTSPPPVAGRPGKPTASKVTHDSIHLTWPGPKSGIDGVEFYSVIYRRLDDPSARWKTTKTQDSQKELTLSGLVANGVYCFKVRAECNAGVSADSELSEPTQTSPPPLPGRPGKPMPSKVSHNSVVLNWSGPETFAQGIKHYLVSYRRADDPSLRWQTLKTQDSQEFIIVSELAAKAVYHFKVSTECETGRGPESEISQIETNPLPIPNPPGKPNALEVSHNTIKLNWSHPQHRAENVKYYTVSYCKSTGFTKRWEEKQTDGATASLTVDNLDAITKYCFKVRADSEAGVSRWSETSPAIRTHSPPPPSQPGKPSFLSVSHDTVVLKWNKPEFGAKDIKHYTVSYYVVEDHIYRDKWKTKKTAGPQESVAVSGLQPRVVYIFNVCAESDAGCSSSSESSDPIELHAPPAPSQPGKPTAFDNDIIHNSILLNWAKPAQSGDYVKRYTISYRRRYDLVDQWKTTLSDGARTTLTVSGLDPKTEYSFKVHAVSDTGISVDSEISVFYTKAKVRLAEEMLSSAVLIENGPPKVYKLRLQEVTVDKDNQLKRCAIGKPNSVNKPEEKVIMVLGATGAGKTTLINGMTNYLLGVEWGDDFRFKLIVDEDTAQAASQTKWITAYTFHHQKGSPLPYTLTIIDTPGFGDTEGIRSDCRITEQIKDFLSMAPPNCIDHLNAIGFVTTASLARLTPTQKYIFEYILAIFGKDIASNIFMMATFADGGVPPVLAAIKAADIPSCDIFKFNNSSLLANPTDTFGKMFWKMGLKSFEDFFAHLKTVQTRSLLLTREVLDEREHLETVIQGLLPQIQTDELQQGEKVFCLQKKAFDMICEAQQILARLDEIALKPNPLTELDYVDLLIESEKQQCKPGYKKRLEYLQEARKNAKLIHQLNKGGDAPQWFYTKAKVRLAEEMLSSAVLIENGPPKVYKLRLQEVTVDKENQLKRCAIGKPNSVNKPEEKVIMVLGATGVGKTTLINGMTNYLLGVEWGDDFRFKLIVDEDTAQAASQTKWITAYTFHHQKGSPLPYTLTIIDTPGFGDTEGIRSDCRITEQIKDFLSMAPPNCIDHLNAIGFVTTASLARLTPTQKYIFEYILAIFGKDIASNIFMMATFADGGVPPVLAAIKAADIPSCDIFKFNNSSLLANPTDTFGKMFWKMGLKSFEDFFAHLKTVQTRSLLLTREVLDEREHLETVIQGLLRQIQTDELQQGEKVFCLQKKTFEMICEAQQILARLDEIALKPNPLTELDYIDLLIESEKQQCKPGYKKRLEYLQEARKNAKLIHQLNKGGDAAEKAKPWHARVRPTPPRARTQPMQKMGNFGWGWPFTK